MAHSKASPSSAKLDAPLVPPGLPTGLSIAARELQTTHEPLTGGTKPVTLSSSMVTPIFWTSSSLGVSVKTREQSIETVLHRELLKGNSLTGIKPSSRIISAPVATMRTVGRAPRKPPDRKGEVSMKKQTSAVEHSPVPKAVLMLLKPAPISFIQVSHVSPSFQATPTLRIPNVISPSRIANLQRSLIEAHYPVV